MALAYVTVTGTWDDGSGQAVTGTVTFTPSATVYSSGQQLVTPSSPVQCPVVNGRLVTASGGPVQLLATDNTGLTLLGHTGFWFWTAAVNIGGGSAGQTDTFSFFLPSGSPVDLYGLANQVLSDFPNPLTALGDLLAGGAGGSPGRLAGNTSAARQFLVSQGTGTAAQAPAWGALQAGDIPSLPYAPSASPALTGTPTAPTASPGTNTTQLATTAFVETAVGGAGAVASVFGRSGAVAAQSGDYAVGQVTGAAPLASPALTGSPTAPTQAPGDNSTKIATDAFVTTAVAAETTRAQAAEALLAPKASPSFTGTVTVPVTVNATDAAQKQYVDSVAQGLDNKQSVTALASSNITLSGAQTIDGVAVTAGQRVLATGQSTASQNGLWVVASGAWTRPADFASGSTQLGASVFVEAGTASGSSGWVLTGATAVTVDTSPQTWTQFSGAGEITAGTGLSKSGNTLNSTGVLSVTAADGSVVTGGTGTAPTLRTGTLDAIAAAHPPVAGVAMNSQKLTGLANGSAASDSAAFGQTPAGGATVTVAQGGTGSTTRNFAGLLTPTAVKTSAYSAVAGDYVPVDTTSGAVTVTLPSAPADLTVIGIKMVIQGGTSTVTFSTGGSDVLNKTGGATSGTLTVLAQGVLLQYRASGGIWYVLADDLPLPQLDARYLKAAGNLSDVASASTALANLGGEPLIPVQSTAPTPSGAGALWVDTSTTPATPLLAANNLSDVASAAAAFNAVSPLTTLGDLIYASGAATAARLAGNTSATAALLAQTGTGSVSAAPAWSTPAQLGLLTSQSYGGMFGDGSDGALTFDGTSTVLGLVPSGSTYTMNRDIFATSLTVNNGVTLVTAGFRLFAAGTLTNNGTVSNNGNAASTFTAGAACPNGTVAGAPAGGTGGTGAGAAPSAAGYALLAVGAGGNGGTGSGGAGGTGTAVNSGNLEFYRTPAALLAGTVGVFASVLRPSGGGSGASGGGDGTNKGGGGGSGGGVVAIFARAAVNNGTISAAGGNGGAATTGNCGGGGAGGGGLIIAYTLSAWTAGTTSVAHGTGGSGIGTGTTGASGASGNVLNVVVQ